MKLLIVEKDAALLAHLIQFVNTSQTSFQHILSASSCAQALATIRSHQPDAVLLSADTFSEKDDKIAFLLALVERGIRSVFAGSSSQLQRLKRCTGLSPVYFLSLPPSQAQVKKVLAAVAADVIRDQTPLPDSYEASLARLKEQFFCELLDGRNLPEDINKRLEFLDLVSSHAKYYLAVVFSFAPLRKPSTWTDDREVWMTSVRVQQIIQKVLETRTVTRTCIREENRIACLLLIEEPGEPFKHELEGLIEDINARVRSECQQQISVGVGLADNTIPGIADGYRQACEALRQGNFFGNSYICFFSDLYDREYKRLRFGRAVKEKISDCLYRSDFYQMDRLIDDEFHKIYELGVASPENILSLKIDLTVFLMDLSNRLSITAEKPALYSLLLNDFLQASSLPELAQKIKQKLREFSQTSASSRQKRTSKIVEDVKKLVADSLSKAENVQTIAYQIGISPNYLSAIFRSETGVRLSAYITKVKMDAASKLLRDTDHRVADIAQMVGFENTNYFSKLFRKQFGKNPSDYRFEMREKG